MAYINTNTHTHTYSATLFLRASQSAEALLQKSLIHPQKSPILDQKSPTSPQKPYISAKELHISEQEFAPHNMQKRLRHAPFHCILRHLCKRALYLRKRALYLRKTALYLRKRALYTRKRDLCLRKSALVSAKVRSRHAAFHCISTAQKNTAEREHVVRFRRSLSCRRQTRQPSQPHRRFQSPLTSSCRSVTYYQ